jgi:serine O-acetyltransferase
LDVTVKRLLGTIKYNLTAGRLWYFSAKAYRAGNRPLAVAIKALIYVVYSAVLCFECEIEDDLEMVHGGFGTMCHPNVTIGKRVKMFHHITLASETLPGSLPRIRIEDDCVIGAYAILIGNDRDGITIGKGSVIGAGTMVVRDVPPGSTIVATPSRAVKPGKSYATGDADS